MDFQILPQIDKISKHFKHYNIGIVNKIAKDTINEIRANPQNFSFKNSEEILDFIEKKYLDFQKISLQSVINLTGIIIHTNLGRAPISPSIWEEVKELVCNYSNLEYSLSLGARSNRYDESAFLLSALFGCEDALVVNNNASAVFLVLNTLCNGKECIVSRGELVEIGGGFRVPDVMKQSGAKLTEIGTTNKTRLNDYQEAINENTKMLLKVHPSNFNIVGFCENTNVESLAKLGKEKNIVTYYDLGGGSATNLEVLGKEPTISQIIKTGVNLVSFSGDKLLGSIQAGIILGKKDLIAKLRKNQLLRMLRCDKTTIAILVSTLRAYLDKNYEKITILSLLKRDLKELNELAININQKIQNKAKIISTSSYTGGGTLPNRKIPSIALCFSGNAKKLEEKFRQKNVIGRIENESFLLDLRSLLSSDIDRLVAITNEILGGKNE